MAWNGLEWLEEPGKAWQSPAMALMASYLLCCTFLRDTPGTTALSAIEIIPFSLLNQDLAKPYQVRSNTGRRGVVFFSFSIPESFANLPPEPNSRTSTLVCFVYKPPCKQ